MQTDLITYNLRDRKRKFRGMDRDYQAPDNFTRIVKVINGGEVQERVKSRDMHGYYGHNTRMVFGLIPQECKLHKGNWVCVEPAFTTTHLKAYKDGNVEHKAEFLDNKYGEMAWRMFQGNVGGFSSAIDEDKPSFLGFDYVHEPNFNDNRGYKVSLDSVSDDALELIREYTEFTDEIPGVILDSVVHNFGDKYAELQNTLSMQSDVIIRMQQEIDEYQAMIVSERKNVPTFDSIFPKSAAVRGSSFLEMADELMTLQDARLESASKPKDPQDRAYDKLSKYVLGRA